MLGKQESIPVEDKIIIISLDDYQDDNSIKVEMEPFQSKHKYDEKVDEQSITKGPKEQKEKMHKAAEMIGGSESGLKEEASLDIVEPDNLLLDEGDLLHDGEDLLHDDFVEILIDKSATERGFTSDEQTFNDLLTNFRRDPALVSKKVRLQTLQDLVVSPDDIKRLIKQVRWVINAKNEFSVEAVPDRPLLNAIVDADYCTFPVEWIRPIIYDQKRLYVKQASAEMLSNQQTIQIADHHSSVLYDYSSFGYPGTAQSRRQPYQTARLHQIARFAFGNRTDISNVDRLQLQTPVNHFVYPQPGKEQLKKPGHWPEITSQYDYACANSEGAPSEFDYKSAIELFRISNNEGLLHLFTKSQDINFEKRVASFPVVAFNIDDEDARTRSAVRQVYKGEELSVIGFAVCNNYGRQSKSNAPDAIENVSVIAEDLPIDIIPDLKDEGIKKWHMYMLKPKAESAGSDMMLKLLKALIPAQSELTNVLKKDFENCYNFGHVADLLNLYNLSINQLAASTVSQIRKIITENIIRYVDESEAASARNNNRVSQIKIKMQSQKGMKLEYFADIESYDVKDYYDFAVSEIRGDSMFCTYLLQSPDNGDLYYILKGLRWVSRESVTDMEKDIANAVNLAHLNSQNNNLEHIYNHEFSVQDSVDIIQKTDSLLHNNDIREMFDVASESMWRKHLKECIIEHKINKSEVICSCKMYNRFKSRQMIESKTYRRQKTDKPINVTSFDLVAFESGEIDSGNDNLIVTESAMFYAPGWNPDGNQTDSIEYTSTEYQQSRNPIIKSSAAFPTTVLINIGDQLLKMKSEEKLDFKISLDNFKRCVYDISEMFDELDDNRMYISKYIKSRLTPGMTADDRTGLIKEARESFHRDIGNDPKVNTNFKVGIIIARILIDLETHRPKYSFKKIFALSGRKTIGKSEDIRDEIFSEENKFNYLTIVASKGSGLGSRGVLMENSQADNLKNIASFATISYDKLCLKPAIQDLYQRAGEFDSKLQTLQQEEHKQDIESGFELIMGTETSIDNVFTKKLMNRFYDYNYSSSDLSAYHDKLYGEYRLLQDFRHMLRRKAKYLSLKKLQSLQELIESNHVEENQKGSYNPDQYGDDTGEAGCRPNSPCIYNIDHEKISSHRQDLSYEGDQTFKMMINSRLQRTQLTVPQRVKYFSYEQADINRVSPSIEEKGLYLSNKSRGNDVSASTVSDNYKTYLINHNLSYIKPVARPIKNFEPPERIDTLYLVNSLVDTITRHIEKQASKRVSDLLLSGLGRWINLYDYTRSLIVSHPDYVKLYQLNRLIPVYQANSQFMRNCNISFRKHVYLIKNGFSILINEYVLKTDLKAGQAKYIDQEVYKGVMARKIAVGSRVKKNDITWLNQSHEPYLIKYERLSASLQDYKFLNELKDIEAASRSDKATDAEATETLLSMITNEMKNVSKHVQASNPSLSDMANDFLIAFLSWCSSLQSSVDITPASVDIDLQKKRETESKKIENLSKTERNDIANLRNRMNIFQGEGDEED